MQAVVFALIGGVVGAFLSSAGVLGWMIAGAVIGALFARLHRLQVIADGLQQERRQAPADTADTAAAGATPAIAVAAVAAAQYSPASPASPASQAPDESLQPPREALPERGIEALAMVFHVAYRIRAWFTSGNVPVKVGVLVSLFGMGFLLREAFDRDWLVLPIEARLLFVAATGVAMLAIGWRLRSTHPAYALSMQGGGIAMLYLTTWVSFAIYTLLPHVPAFGCLIVITAAAVMLAVAQDARALAVLGITGGFLAPLLVASEAGSHVMLFSYYLIVNTAVAAVAWFRAWRELNVIGFLFTFGVGAWWGYAFYDPAHYATTQPFLIVFVMLYSLLPVLFATRQAPSLKGLIDGTLVFGTPVAGFALQAGLVGDTRYGLAISAVALAVWYFAMALWLRARDGAGVRDLIDAQFGLSVVFLILAVPLALDAGWTSAVWALQGAAMVWLGVRQRRLLALAAGVLLQVGAGVAYLMASRVTDPMPVLNADFIGIVVLAAAAAAAGRWLDGRAAVALPRGCRLLPGPMLALATIWWLGGGIVEIGHHVTGPAPWNAILMLVAATVTAAFLLAPPLHWPRLNVLGLLAAPTMVLAALLVWLMQGTVTAHFGWLAWLMVLAAHYAFLRLREHRFPRLRSALHVCGYWVIASLIAIDAGRRLAFAADAWMVAAVLLLLSLFVFGSLRARSVLRWPLAAHWHSYVVPACGGVVATLAASAVAVNFLMAGEPMPWRFVPLFNPLEASLVVVAVIAVLWWRAASDEFTDQTPAWLMPAAVAAFGLSLLTMSVARSVHHFTAVPFQLEALLQSSVFQAALSIAWGVVGFVAMLTGARRGSRPVWVAGSALMALVVLKLFVVELAGAGTIERIVSFLAVGVLLLVVGYFAPVPPREGAPSAPQS